MHPEGDNLKKTKIMEDLEEHYFGFLRLFSYYYFLLFSKSLFGV